MPKKFLITGFTGQVGSQLVDFLLKNTDFELIGMMRWQEPLNNISHLIERINRKDRLSIFYADLNDHPSIYRMIDLIRPDFISHLAAQSYPRTSFDIPIETLQTNIIGTANFLEVIKQIRNKETSYDPVIHVCSSSEVYGKVKKKGHLTEDSTFHGSSPYSISKIGADFLGRYYGEAFNLKTLVTRMGTHSGPRRSDVFFESTVAKQIALIEFNYQDPIIKIGNLDSVRTFQDVRDAVDAYYKLIIAADNGLIKPGDVFNIAGKEAFNLREIVEILLSFSERKDITYKCDQNRLRPIDADYQMYDNTKISSTIDWEPEITVKEMLLDLLNHWRHQIKNGNIPLNR